ncbi:hypothetical protein [Paenibacillus puerhi]|uniref:hypothetical protein n=1 Tax=Paenibacillus puerhi TaxID=2692622 RepID=UPI00135AFE1E|nr:hypothetical protein [Paenibacillus puerhi]
MMNYNIVNAEEIEALKKSIIVLTDRERDEITGSYPSFRSWTFGRLMTIRCY